MPPCDYDMAGNLFNLKAWRNSLIQVSNIVLLWNAWFFNWRLICQSWACDCGYKPNQSETIETERIQTEQIDAMSGIVFWRHVWRQKSDKLCTCNHLPNSGKRALNCLIAPTFKTYEVYLVHYFEIVLISGGCWNFLRALYILKLPYTNQWLERINSTNMCSMGEWHYSNKSIHTPTVNGSDIEYCPPEILFY